MLEVLDFIFALVEQASVVLASICVGVILLAKLAGSRPVHGRKALPESDSVSHRRVSSFRQELPEWGSNYATKEVKWKK